MWSNAYISLQKIKASLCGYQKAKNSNTSTKEGRGWWTFLRPRLSPFFVWISCLSYWIKCLNVSYTFCEKKLTFDQVMCFWIIKWRHNLTIPGNWRIFQTRWTKVQKARLFCNNKEREQELVKPAGFYVIYCLFSFESIIRYLGPPPL